MKIPGVYVEIKGDTAQLKQDMSQAKQLVTEQAKGMSEAINNALSSGQIKSSVTNLTENLGTLARSAHLTDEAFDKLGVELGELRSITKMTDADFKKLQSQMLNTQSQRAQENALRQIARQANLTEKEIRELGAQFKMSEAQIGGVVGVSDKAAKSIDKVGRATESVAARMKTMIATVAIYSGAFAAVSGVMSAIGKEFKLGFSSIEEFNQTVASSAAYITSFSKLSQEGHLGEAYREAADYAKLLAEQLEMVDSRTIASGKDLQDMSETFIKNGVLLNLNNKDQVQGFTNIATALALVTKGQDKEMQIRQEINSLMKGQVRAADQLAKFLQAVDPELQKHLIAWKQEGVLIEKVGGLLQGFSSNTGDLDDLWMTVGSTMDTINKRILRGGFEPAFNDLIGLAKDFNASLMDAEGNLSPLAQDLQEAISESYGIGKTIIKEYGGEVATLAKYLIGAKVAQVALNLSVSKNPYVMAASALLLLNEQLKAFDMNLGSLDGKWDAYTKAFNNVREGLNGTRDASTGRLFTEQEKIINQITELEKQLSGDKPWYQFSLFDDPNAEAARITEVTGKIAALRNQLTLLNDAESLTRLGKKSSTISVPELIAQPDEETDDKAAAKARAKAQSAQLKEYERNLKEQADLRADLTQKVKELTLSENDYKHWMLDVELADMRTHAQGQKDILDQIEAYAKAKNVQLNIEFNEDIDDALKDFFDDIDKLGDKSVETADDMKDAFSGWASSMSSDMNDVLWGAELTFDSMAESFGKMITQMIIQKSVLEPIMDGLFGDGTSGSTGLLSGIFDGFHSGGIVGSDSPTFTRALPRFHSGGIIGSDEVPAILQKGEGVFTAGQMAALGSGSGGNTNINIINNTSGSVTTSEKPNSSGGMDLEIIIDQLVAKKMNSAGSATQKAMYSTTGASRQLTRR